MEWWVWGLVAWAMFATLATLYVSTRLWLDVELREAFDEGSDLWDHGLPAS